MSYGLAFGFPRNTSLAAAASPFTQLGPTLDLNFAGAPTTGLVSNNNSLDLNFTGNTYTLGAPYMVWSGSGMTASSFQNIITFSRASGNATYYNSSGYLTLAGVLNYLLYSNQPENAAWTKSNSFVQTNQLLYSEDITNGVWLMLGTAGGSRSANVTTAPNGTMTADSYSVGTGTGAWYIANYLTPSVVNGQSYTASMYLKANGYNFAFIRPHNNTSIIGSSGFIVSLIDGTITYPSAGSAPTSTGTATNVGNGWWRVSATSTANATAASLTGGPAVYPCPSTDFINAGGAGPANFTGDGVSGVYIWGGQFVQGAVPGDYQATIAASLAVLYADFNNALLARKVCENAVAGLAHGIRQNVTTAAAETYTVSFYAKAGERNFAAAWSFGGLASTTGRVFNLTNGTTQGAGGFVPSTYGMINAGSGWWRCWYTFTTSTGGGTTTNIGPHDGGANDAYNGDGTSGVYITDIQIELGATPSPYYDTTANVYNAPRFDYDPATLLPRGLLVESQRTNLLTRSNSFPDAAWVALSAKNVAAATTVSPDGTLNAWVLTDSSAVAYEGIQQGVAVAVDTTTYTASVFVRKTTGGTSATFGTNLAISGGTTVTTQPRLNTDTGAIISGVGTVQDAGAYWRLSCSVTNNGTAGNTALSISLYPATSAYNTVGDSSAATGSATVYGAQLEAGAFATSYIPTVASQLTRAVDVANIGTVSPWFNKQAGTIFAEASIYTTVGLGVLTAFNNGAFYATGSGFLLRTDGVNVSAGGNSSNVNIAPISANTVFRAAGGYQGVNQLVGLNGATPSSNALCDFTGVGTAALTIGSLAAGSGTQQTNGWIRRISYYPRRLTNTELQTLTT